MRLIDADELRKVFDPQIQFIIDHAPTIELNTVMHGHWMRKRRDDDECTIVRCSICQEEWHVADDSPCDLILDELISDDMKFCPSCGAKMDGGLYGKDEEG